MVSDQNISGKVCGAIAAAIDKKEPTQGFPLMREKINSPMLTRAMKKALQAKIQGAYAAGNARETKATIRGPVWRYPA